MAATRQLTEEELHEFHRVMLGVIQECVGFDCPEPWDQDFPLYQERVAHQNRVDSLEGFIEFVAAYSNVRSHLRTMDVDGVLDEDQIRTAESGNGEALDQLKSQFEAHYGISLHV